MGSPPSMQCCTEEGEEAGTVPCSATTSPHSINYSAFLSLPLDINLSAIESPVISRNSSGEGPSSDQLQTTEAEGEGESDAWFDDSCKDEMGDMPASTQVETISDSTLIYICVLHYLNTGIAASAAASSCVVLLLRSLRR
ncbi:hypothetical protein GW17_00039951 [Ensete ventricosum]|nr:hypothetical protein GW17_00039951 [Ensete ventricosum]